MRPKRKKAQKKDENMWHNKVIAFFWKLFADIRIVFGCRKIGKEGEIVDFQVWNAFKRRPKPYFVCIIVFFIILAFCVYMCLSPSGPTHQDQPIRTNQFDASYWQNLISANESSPSLHSLLPHTFKIRNVWDEDISVSSEIARCARYNMKISDDRKRRRIFYGSLIADDSWHTLAFAAMEGYGVFHTVAFVESNRTQSLVPRTMRFEPGSDNLRILQESGMWGPITQVTVDQHFQEASKFKSMGALMREDFQRENILIRWKQNGMREDDIGYISDIDEVVTRDFLRALQICDVPAFKVETCDKPKVITSTIVFESTPSCLYRDRRLYHPDLIIGKCIDQIGHRRGSLDDDSLQPTDINPYPLTRYGTGEFADQLWKARDFRMISGSSGPQVTGQNGEHTAFHFHNFFHSFSVLRFKYRTYGHPMRNADAISLGKMPGDVQFAVSCVQERDVDGPPRLEGGWEALSEDIAPIAFRQAQGYAEQRHKEVKEMIENDEQQFGREE